MISVCSMESNYSVDGINAFVKISAISNGNDNMCPNIANDITMSVMYICDTCHA